MIERLKRKFLLIGMVAMMLQIFPVTMANAQVIAGEVVINEVAWAGTADNSNDEWIELYNNTSSEIDLSNWQIVDDGSSVYKIASGMIAPHGYFLIEDVEEATNVKADAVIGLSLANAGDSLVLKNDNNEIVDTLNGNGGAWYAGSSDTKATMERIDPAVKIDQADNFASAFGGNQASGRTNLPILGTPKGANSNFGGSGPEVKITPVISESGHGKQVVFGVEISEASDLYSYGFDLHYDSEVLKFITAEEGDFLKSGNVQTAFNFALEDGVDGDLLVGDARLVNPPNGVDGAGQLFELTFEVVGNNGDVAEIGFEAGSFISDSVGDVATKFIGSELSVKDKAAGVVTELKAKTGIERYSLELSWVSPLGGAGKYIISRLQPDGQMIQLGETVDLTFVDKDAVVNGGKLIPGVDYTYEVVAVSEGVNSDPVQVVAKETRGVKGDIDRNDRVDGRDIEKMARAYGSEFADEEYSLMGDLNFDGYVDGKDLIDLAVNFGLKYKV